MLMKSESKFKRVGRMFTINLLLAAIIAGLYIALIHPYSTEAVAVSGFPIYKGSNRDCVALECAVSWDAKALPEILDLLNKSGVNITFAVSGEWAENNGDLLRRILSEGHELAIMGYSPDKDGKASFIQNDLKKSCEIIKSETGFDVSLYYCGNRNTNVSAIAARRCKLTPIKCTLDLLCANGGGEDIFSRIKGNTNGGNILLVSPTQGFLEALPDILAYFYDKGLTITTVSSTIYN